MHADPAPRAGVCGSRDTRSATSICAGSGPFPTDELRECLGRFKGVGVIDRDFAHGSPDNAASLMHEVRSCLYSLRERPNVINFIGGLGGRDISIEECIKMYESTLAAGRDVPEELVSWTGLRE